MQNVENKPINNEQSLDSHYIEHQTIIPSNPETALIDSVEILTEQGNKDKNNEDSIYANPDNGIAGVFDGASDIVGYRTPDGLTGGAVASRIAANELESSDPNESLVDIILRANNTIAEFQKEMFGDEVSKEERFCTTGAITRIRQDESGNSVIDLLQVADSVAIVVYDDGRVEAPLGLHDQDQETLLLYEQMVSEGMSGAEIMQDERMKNQIKSKREESNLTYGVINGEESVDQFISSTTISSEGVSRIIVLTDGLFIPKANPEQEEDWSEYARLEAEGGIRAIRDHVREIEAADSDCTNFPRFKKHDDGSGIVIKLS